MEINQSSSAFSSVATYASSQSQHSAQSTQADRDRAPRGVDSAASAHSLSDVETSSARPSGGSAHALDHEDRRQSSPVQRDSESSETRADERRGNRIDLSV